MLKIAITGNIASGKSTVEKIIEELGYKVFDTDKIAHEILKKSEEVKEIFNTFDRKEIAKIVFSDREKLKLLESIIHPQVKVKLEEIFLSNYEIVFVSVPQLFEAGFECLFDKIIFVTADKNIRLERLMKRNLLTKKEALIRINAQNDEKEKIDKSDYIIENNLDEKELKKLVTDILSILIG